MPASWEPEPDMAATTYVDLKYLLHGPDDIEGFSNLTITFSHDGEMLACCNSDMVVRTSVSYTHLTLPTSLAV